MLSRMGSVIFLSTMATYHNRTVQNAISAICLLLLTTTLRAQIAKETALNSLGKSIETAIAGYQKEIDALHLAEVEKLKKYERILNDLKVGDMTLAERNQGASLVSDRTRKLARGMEALRESEIAGSSGPRPGHVESISDPVDIVPNSNNTIPPGSYTIETCASEHALIFINGKNVLREKASSIIGASPIRIEYEVTGPIQITVKAWSILGQYRHGFAFRMIDGTGKEFINTRSGWKSYRVDYYADWFMEKEIKNIGRVIENKRPSPLGKAPYIWDARQSSAALCYLVWGK